MLGEKLAARDLAQVPQLPLVDRQQQHHSSTRRVLPPHARCAAWGAVRI